MTRVLIIIFVILTAVLVAAGSLGSERFSRSSDPAEAAAQEFLAKVKQRDWNGAYAMVASSSDVQKDDFIRDINGSDGSLKTLSSLQSVSTKVLNETGDSAKVRAHLNWATAVGALEETRDLALEKKDGEWKVDWSVPKDTSVPPQVIPVNYLRWDVINRGASDDWGAQNVEAPRVRIVSMNAIEKDDSVIIMGEVVNEDTVPAFVNVSAELLDKSGKAFAEESSFDKISHTLLPKEVSPFRIDFPHTKLSRVDNVRMNPTSLLVPASADPVIAVLHQRIEKDSRGRTVLRGELVNESGQTVNIPHVLATYYDNNGHVVWVSDGYVDRALVPQVPVPFAVELRNDVAQEVHSSRVTVNEYTLKRTL